MILKPWLAAGLTVLTIGATACSKSDKPTTPSTSGTSTSASASATSSEPTAPVRFNGFFIDAATDLMTKPRLAGKGDHTPTKIEIRDLVVGTGPAATPQSTVTVQYLGFRVSDGFEFDSSWSRGGTPATFPLNGVVVGFAQGIGGTTGVEPMKVGGRRVMMFPASLGYGARGSAPDIPPNAAIAFIVDLTDAQ